MYYFPHDAIDRLENWLDSLERLYVVLALQVAEYEGATEPGSPHQDYDQLDRLEADMKRAKLALEFCRQRSSEVSPACQEVPLTSIAK
jgi:hypothetical protein